MKGFKLPYATDVFCALKHLSKPMSALSSNFYDHIMVLGQGKSKPACLTKCSYLNFIIALTLSLPNTSKCQACFKDS